MNQMTVKDFFKWADKEYATEMELMRVKGEEYTVSDEDKLKNFKSIADRLDVATPIVAMVFLLKHMDSIRNYILNGVEASDEPISGRIRDARGRIMNICNHHLFGFIIFFAVVIIGIISTIKDSKDDN